jgi:hypothetical protein
MAHSRKSSADTVADRREYSTAELEAILNHGMDRQMRRKYLSVAKLPESLEYLRYQERAVFPELSQESWASVNAAHERCDQLIKDAEHGNEKQRLMAADRAASNLLDVLAEECLPVAGILFPRHTLELLGGISIGLYGAEDVVRSRMAEWRARWWESKDTRAAIPNDTIHAQVPASDKGTTDPFNTQDKREAALARISHRGSSKKPLLLA